MPTGEGREQLRHPPRAASAPARGSPQTPATTSTQVPRHGCPRRDLTAAAALPAPVQRPLGQEEEAVPPTMPGSTPWHPAGPLTARAPAGAADSAFCNLMPGCVSTAGPPAPPRGIAKHVPPTPGPAGTPGPGGALSPQDCTLMWGGVTPSQGSPQPQAKWRWVLLVLWKAVGSGVQTPVLLAAPNSPGQQWPNTPVLPSPGTWWAGPP